MFVQHYHRYEIREYTIPTYKKSKGISSIFFNQLYSIPICAIKEREKITTAAARKGLKCHLFFTSKKTRNTCVYVSYSANVTFFPMRFIVARASPSHNGRARICDRFARQLFFITIYTIHYEFS